VPDELNDPLSLPQERSRGEWRGIVLRLGVALVVLAGGYLGLAYYLGERIPAGTTVEGVDVGTLSEASARSVLADKLTDLASAPVQVELDGEQARLTPAESGLAFDLDDTVAGVASVSFDPRDMWARLTGDGRQVELTTSIDTEALEAAVESTNETLSREPVQATVVLSRGQVKTTLPEDGVLVDAAKTAEDIASGWPQETSVTAQSTTVAAAFTAEEVEAFVTDVAKPALADSIVIDVDTTVTISPNQLSRLLSVQGAGGEESDGEESAFGEGLALIMDPEGAADIVAGALVDVEQPAKDATVRLADNNKPKIVKAKVGKEVNEPGVVLALAEIVQADLSVAPDEGTDSGGDDAASTSGSDASDVTAAPDGQGPVTIDGRTITVETVEVQPDVTDKDAKKWKVDKVMADFSTEFPTGADNVGRTENIRVGLTYVNGTVVMPGDQFSLADTLAPISRDRGYVDAGVIVSGRLVKGIGGGLSQVSTAVLNTAWFSGVQLDAFQPHQYYISRYPAGREATISVGSIDNVWTNDTTSPIIVRTYIEGNSIVMKFYGDRQHTVKTREGERRNFTSPEIKTETGPDCLDQGAVDGFTITMARDLVKSGDVVHTDEYTTTYQPSNGVTCQ